VFQVATKLISISSKGIKFGKTKLQKKITQSAQCLIFIPSLLNLKCTAWNPERKRVQHNSSLFDSKNVNLTMNGFPSIFKHIKTHHQVYPKHI